MKIGIVEDDPKFAKMLMQEISSASVGSVVHWLSGEEFLKSGSEDDINILILDIGLPGMTGIELLKKFHAIPNRKSIVISSLHTDDIIFSALRLGTSGYLWKSELSTIPELIEIISKGGSVISPSIASRVMNEFRRLESNMGKKTSSPEMENLTNREQEILESIIDGFTPKEIATSFGTSEGTVRQQIKSIYKKLEVNSRVELMKKARDMGIF